MRFAEPERGVAGQIGEYLAQGLRLMVGMPDYGKYLEHMRMRHPGRAVMSYEEFFVDRQRARHGGGGRLTRCC
jgi:uncharacterized short protein YbdD (DUF466 family)